MSSWIHAPNGKIIAIIKGHSDAQIRQKALGIGAGIVVLVALLAAVGLMLI